MRGLHHIEADLEDDWIEALDWDSFDRLRSTWARRKTTGEG